jgi:SAM-dependent methyltransferase
MTDATALTLAVRAGGPTTDPTALFDIAEGMHAIEALTASVGWLHLYEWLAEHPSDEAAICSGLALAPRPAHVLLTLLASLELVHRNEDGVYSLTELAREHLLPDSPWSLAPCFEALKDRPTCLAMLGVLRSGKPMGGPPDGGPPDPGMAPGAGPGADQGPPGPPADPGPRDGGPPSWAAGMDEEAFAEMFLRAIDSRNAYLAHAVAAVVDLSRRERVLDVGGGSGIYACALVRHNPQLCATVMEKPPVDRVARRAIEGRGLAERVAVTAGDMLSAPLPADHDVHLFSNVVHDWDEDTARQLFRASLDALPAGGQILIHDAFLDDSGSGPRAVAEYSVLLMSFTSGRCYSVPEIRRLLEEVGFVRVTHRATVVHRSVVSAYKPPRKPGAVQRRKKGTENGQ